MKKIISLILCAVMTAALFTACTQQAAETASNTVSASNENTVYGEVTAADNDQVTLTLGTMDTPEMPIGENPQPDASGAPNASGMPSGDAQSGSDNTSGGTPPDMPDGSGAPDTEAPSGGMGGTMPGNFTSNGMTLTLILDESVSVTKQNGMEESSASFADIAVGDILKMTGTGEDENFKPTSITILSLGMGGPGNTEGSATGSIELTGVYTVDSVSETADNQGYSSASADQNTVLVKNGGDLTITGGTLSKSGDSSSADESNFYGLNAVLAVTGGSSASISGMELTSSAEGANAVFSTGEGSVVKVDGITIHTTGDSSRGLDATYGGSIIATNVDITTQGAHCAPIATDRGEGTVNVTGGTLSAAGDGSPCIYSTGNITVSDITGTATGSQAAVVEGKNSITMTDTALTGAGENGVMLYQSTSGDAAEGTASFTATDSSLTTTSAGPMFYVTNTDAQATLENTMLSFPGGTLANVAGNDTNNWGTPGSNGGNFTLTGVKQTLTGDITCDAISTVTLNLTDGTTYTGAINADHTAQNAAVSLDATSTWTLTGDSYVTELSNADETCANILSGGYNVYYDADAAANAWLDGQTISLSGGGSLMPAE